MMRALFALFLCAFMLPVHAAISWSDLWRNPDQQGEDLMQQGKAAAAAKVYKDTRHKAYAELKAGDYAAAARDLSAFDDGDAQYNRGNALAYAGDLQGALTAYDAALKRDPQNRDAIHNRDLVANALKQQPPQQKQDSKNNASKDGKHGQQGKSSAKDQAQSGQDANPSQGGKQAGQSGMKPNASAQNGKPDDQAGTANNSAQAKPAGENNTPTQSAVAQGQSGNQALQPQGDKNARSQPAQRADDAAQAQRDAAASLDNALKTQQNGQARRQAAAPMTEQQMAQEQWLRSIPDDPGGLLRRKFLIEHLLRQKARP